MMCLGWMNRATCLTRGSVELVPASPDASLTTGAVPGGTDMGTTIDQSQSGIASGGGSTMGAIGGPDVTWFWVGLGIIGVAAIARAGGHKR